MNKESEIVIRVLTEKISQLEGENTWLKSENQEMKNVIYRGNIANEELSRRVDEAERKAGNFIPASIKHEMLEREE